jgi:hypothetical protein
LKCSPSSSKATSEEVSPSSETDKSSVLETCLEEKKTQIIGNIISDTMRELHKRFRSVAYAGSVTTKSSVNGSSAAESGTSSGFGDGKRKRSTASGERNAEDMDGEDDTGTNGRRDKGREIGMTESSKFACPYFKYDTHKYKNWKTCPGPGWNDVHRVKYASGPKSTELLDHQFGC